MFNPKRKSVFLETAWNLEDIGYKLDKRRLGLYVRATNLIRLQLQFFKYNYYSSKSQYRLIKYSKTLFWHSHQFFLKMLRIK